MGAHSNVGRKLALSTMLLAIGGCAISFGGYELDEGDGGTSGSSSGSSVGGAAGASGSASSGVGTAGAAGAASTGGASGSTGTDASATGAGGNGGGAGGSSGSGASGTSGSSGAGGGGGRDASAGAAGSSGGGPAGAAGAAGSTGTAGAGGGARDGGGGTAGGATGGSGGIATDGGADADGGGARGCPLLPGPQLIEIPLPAGAQGAPGRYCIDQTEVTNRQYETFLATNPSASPAAQPAFCSWNTSFAPAAMASAENCPNVGVYDPVGRPNHPVSCVDWCDAFAYCKSIGKNLCRAFGGIPVPAGKAADVASDEWYAACSAAGTQKFAYGNTYQGSSCNMDTFGAPGAVVVGLAATCRSPVTPYEFLSDLNGNVAEWEDACSGAAGATDNCNVRGGSFVSFNSPDPTRAGDCISLPTSARARRSNQIGFRCCYDGN